MPTAPAPTPATAAPYPLILGASGLTGSEIARQLSALSVNIRVTYREQSDLNLLRNFSVEPFYADYEKPETVQKAMTGVNCVVLILPVLPQFEDWGKMAIDAARAAKVSHLTFLSNFSVDKGGSAAIAYSHKQLEQYIIDSGIPYTILRPSVYFQNLLWSTITIVRQKRFSLPLENAKLPHIDMRDVAAAVSTVVLASETHQNKIYTLTGSEALSMFDVARLISRQSKTTIRYYPTPLATAREAFRAMGMTDALSQMIAEIYTDYATLDLSGIVNDFNRLCSRPPRTFSAFIEEHADIFSGKI